MELHLEGRGYQVVVITRPTAMLGFIYSDPPDLVIIDLAAGGEEAWRVLRELKHDSYFSVVPVIGILSDAGSADWESSPLDDFVLHPVNYEEFFNRISLSQQRIRRIFDNNPLSKLPGNTSIQHAIEDSLGKPRAVCYIDINNFKPYNDTYGFSRGDDVIRMVARIMANAVRESGDNGFVGHVGGDDFVFIVPGEHAEGVCRTIIEHFTVIASDLFDEEDKARGHYRAKDRQGLVQDIPLLGLAIGVVPMDNPMIQHAGKVAEVAADLKKMAKKSSTSTFVIDRRRTPR